MIEGTGTHFEVNNSEYLNIVLDSSETITLRLESVPEMVTMHIEPASDATSTQITISGFSPSATYYKYEDDYHNLVEFTTDGKGSYLWTQDLSQSHLVFIQPRKSTKFINDNATGGDCYLIGIWDSATKTCTLTTDVYETIQIDSNYITLDGNGHMITGTGTGDGVYLPWRRTGVTIKNLNVKNFSIGIFLWYSSYNTVTNNTALNNFYGIALTGSSNNTLTNNTVSNNTEGIGIHAGSNTNTLTNNTATNNSWGINIWNSSENNTLTANTSCNNTSGDFSCGRVSIITGIDNMGDKLLFVLGCPIINLTPCKPSDTTSPSTTVTLSGTSGNNGWYISGVAISLSATDSDSGVKEIHYSVDGIETVVSGSSASLTISTEGMYTLSYYAVDNADNNETSHSLSINIDKTSPVITITGISDGATYQLGMVPTPGYTATDNFSGVASSSANDTDDNGTCRIMHTYTVTASDIAGNGTTKVATYYVTSTSAGVTELIGQMVASGLITGDGIANSLRQQAENNNWNAFINHINAQTGKFIDTSAADLLIQAANIAMQC